MPTIHQSRKKDNTEKYQDEMRQVFFRVPADVHRHLRLIQVEMEARGHKRMTLQAMLGMAVTEFVERNRK